MQRSHFFLVLMVIATTSAARILAAPGASKTQKAFDLADDSVVSSIDGIVVWRRRILDPATAMRERSTYISAYFVQRVGAPASLAYESGPVTSPTETAVLLKDNSLLICAGTLLRWVRDGRAVREEVITLDSGTPSVLALYPDGLIATSTQRGKPDQLYWIPIGKDGVDSSRSVRLEAEIGSHLWLEFSRWHSEIAWIDSTKVPPGGVEKADRVSLYVFDVGLRTMRSVKIHAPVANGTHLSAFNGHEAIYSAELIDTATGNVKEIKTMRGIPLALIGNNAYCVDDRAGIIEVDAIPLSQMTHSSAVFQIAKSKLAKANPELRFSVHDLFFTDEHTIYAWNGATWEDILSR